MNIKKIKLSKLKHLPGNPNVMTEADEAKLAKSMEEFGYVEPIVWNKKTGHVVGGNHRLIVLKKSGVKEVEVVEVSLTPSREKALSLVLNKVHGDFDIPMLADMLLEIDTGEFDLEITGFDELELRAIADGPREPSEPGTSQAATMECPKCGHRFEQ